MPLSPGTLTGNAKIQPGKNKSYRTGKKSNKEPDIIAAAIASRHCGGGEGKEKPGDSANRYERDGLCINGSQQIKTSKSALPTKLSDNAIPLKPINLIRGISQHL